MNRSGEVGVCPMRTDRFFAVSSSWYFSTREKVAVGPYQDKKEAKQGLSDFIEYMTLQNTRQIIV